MILYFSGTGNSRYVARELSRLLGDGEPLEMVSVPDCLDAAGRPVVWVFPIYSWGVPPVVKECMERIAVIGAAQDWMVCTCGDDIGYADRQWRDIVHRCGRIAAGCFSVQMPNTYVTLPGFDVDSGRVEQCKLSAAPQRVAMIASRIFAGDMEAKPEDVVKGALPWLKSRVVYPWFVKHAMSPRGFSVTDGCVGCGRCVRECPLENIVMGSGGRPEWRVHCAFCLRCYHTCPVHAVKYGCFTGGKGQYLCPC